MDAVWVHNKNCFIAIGDNPADVMIDGKTVTYSDYIVGMNANNQPIIKRIPTILDDGKIVEVKVEGNTVKIVNDDKPDTYYEQTNDKLVARDSTGNYAKNEHKKPPPVVEKTIPEHLVTNKDKRLFNGIVLDERLPDPTAGWDYKPSQTKPKQNSTENHLNSHINGYVEEIKLANRVASEGYIILKWGDGAGTHGSDIISIDPKTNTVVLWDNKYRSSGNKLELSPTFDSEALTKKGERSNAWDGAKQEAVKAIRANPNLEKNLKDKLVNDVLAGNLETRTVGSGSLQGQEIIQKYFNNQKVGNGHTNTNGNINITNTSEAIKCNPLKNNLCNK